MKRVRGGRRDLGVNLGGSQAERCVNRIVVGVNQVVDRAGMLGIFGENPLGNSGGAHVRPKVPFRVSGPKIATAWKLAASRS